MVRWYDIGLINDANMRALYFRKRHEFEFQKFPSFQTVDTQKTKIWNALWTTMRSDRSHQQYGMRERWKRHELLHRTHRICLDRKYCSDNGPTFFRKAAIVLGWMESLGLVQKDDGESVLDLDYVRAVHIGEWEAMLDTYKVTLMEYKAGVRRSWMKETWRRAKRAPDWAT